MSRVRPGPVTKSRHKKVLKAAKGYYGARSRTFKTAAQAVDKGGCKPDGSSLTGNFEKTKVPKTTNIKDNTHDNAGLLILTSVKYI